MRQWITLLAGLVLSINSNFGQIHFVQVHVNDALDLSRQRNKPIFLMVYSDWCIPCQKMDNEVFRNPIIANFTNSKYVCVRANIEDFQGQSFSKKFGVRALPSLLIIQPNGDVSFRNKGGLELLEFLQFVKEPFKDESLLEKFDKDYDSNKNNPLFLRQYAEILFNNEKSKYKQIAKEYLQTQEDWNTIINLNFIFQYALEDPLDKTFTYALINREDFINIFGADYFDRKVVDVIGQYQYLMDGMYSAHRLKPLIEKYLPNHGSRHILSIQISRLILADKFEMDELLYLTTEYLDQYQIQDWYFLYKICNKIYQERRTPDDLQYAKKWIIKSISIEKTYQNIELLAKIEYELGNTEQSNDLLVECKALAKQSDIRYKASWK